MKKPAGPPREVTVEDVRRAYVTAIDAWKELLDSPSQILLGGPLADAADEAKSEAWRLQGKAHMGFWHTGIEIESDELDKIVKAAERLEKLMTGRLLE